MSISSYISLNKPSRHFDTLTTIISSSSANLPVKVVTFSIFSSISNATAADRICLLDSWPRRKLKCDNVGLGEMNKKSSFSAVKVSGGFKFQPFSAHFLKEIQTTMENI